MGTNLRERLGPRQLNYKLVSKTIFPRQHPQDKRKGRKRRKPVQQMPQKKRDKH